MGSTCCLAGNATSSCDYIRTPPRHNQNITIPTTSNRIATRRADWKYHRSVQPRWKGDEYLLQPIRSYEAKHLFKLNVRRHRRKLTSKLLYSQPFSDAVTTLTSVWDGRLQRWIRNNFPSQGSLPTCCLLAVETFSSQKTVIFFTLHR